jgi:hypothetical protein
VKDLLEPDFIGFIALSALMVLGACKATSDDTHANFTAAKSLEQRLQCLEDREEIRQLLLDYGRFLDRREFAAFSGLFSENNGQWIGGMGSARGRQAILSLMEEKIGSASAESPAAGFHLFMNESILLDGDRAFARTKWVFVMQDPEQRPQPLLLGHYEDDLVREKEGWKFLKRVVYSDIPKDNPVP